MGIDKVGLDALLFSSRMAKKEKSLQIGRQNIHMNQQVIKHIFKRYGIEPDVYIVGEFSEGLMRDIGFIGADSLDNSSFENANVIQDMNKPVPPELKDQYDYIFDGGSIEHVFNTLQFCTNIRDMLKVGGIYCAVTCNNNFSGHGVYQFSPDFFRVIFSEKYGMKLHYMWIAVMDTELHQWVDVRHLSQDTVMFDTRSPVYIITITEKISDSGESLFESPPNQTQFVKAWENAS